MSGLIKREDAIKAIEELPNAYNGWSDAYDKAYIIGTLEEVPSADRPQIVRCGECNEWNEYARDELGRCDCHLITTRADDFCSYGSRSEKPNNSTRSILEHVGKE